MTPCSDGSAAHTSCSTTLAAPARRLASGWGRTISSYSEEIEVTAVAPGPDGSGACCSAATVRAPRRSCQASGAHCWALQSSLPRAVPVKGPARLTTSVTRSATSGQNFTAQTGSAPPWLWPTTAIRRSARREALRTPATTYSAARVKLPSPSSGSRTVQVAKPSACSAGS